MEGIARAVMLLPLPRVRITLGMPRVRASPEHARDRAPKREDGMTACPARARPHGPPTPACLVTAVGIRSRVCRASDAPDIRSSRHMSNASSNPDPSEVFPAAPAHQPTSRANASGRTRICRSSRRRRSWRRWIPTCTPPFWRASPTVLVHAHISAVRSSGLRPGRRPGACVRGVPGNGQRRQLSPPGALLPAGRRRAQGSVRNHRPV